MFFSTRHNLISVGLFFRRETFFHELHKRGGAKFGDIWHTHFS
jgi:hypothetical protein